MPLENPVLAGNHRIRPLPFDSTRLTGLSNQLLLSHHREYAAAVRELNGVERDLARVGERTPPDLVARLRERELALTNSAILHEHYFESLGSNGHRSGRIVDMLARAHSSFERWEQLFRASAAGLAKTGGWVVLAYNFESGDLRTYAAPEDAHGLAFGQPLIALDMHGHAYAADYGSDANAYVDAFFRNLDWVEVERRFARAFKASAAQEQV